MSVITDTWRQLVRRRLWPVALLLVAALAAVPFVLGQDPEPAPAVPPAAATDASEGVLASAPLVSVAEPADRAKRRRVLGVRHDIFKPTKKAPKAPKVVKAAKSRNRGSSGGATATGGSGSTGSTGWTSGPSSTGSTVHTGPSTPDTPTTGGSTPATPKPVAPVETFPKNSLTVRFGDASQDSLEKMTLERLEALPSVEEPIAIYLGLEDDGKTALFLLDAGVETTGDGVCRPDPANCETIALKIGETEFLDIVDEAGEITAQYQLDVIKAHNVTTADSADDAAADSVTRLIKGHVAARGLRAEG
jgi:hypothetical protein